MTLILMIITTTMAGGERHQAEDIGMRPLGLTTNILCSAYLPPLILCVYIPYMHLEPI